MEALWPEETLPVIYTADNSLKLALQSRILMLVWACGPTENFPHDEMLLGQVNIKMKDLIQGNDGYYHLFQQCQVCLSNMEVGQAHIKVKYS